MNNEDNDLFLPKEEPKTRKCLGIGSDDPKSDCLRQFKSFKRNRLCAKCAIRAGYEGSVRQKGRQND